jgi:hypothetical protein
VTPRSAATLALLALLGAVLGCGGSADIAVELGGPGGSDASSAFGGSGGSAGASGSGGASAVGGASGTGGSSAVGGAGGSGGSSGSSGAGRAGAAGGLDASSGSGGASGSGGSSGSIAGGSSGSSGADAGPVDSGAPDVPDVPPAANAIHVFVNAGPSAPQTIYTNGLFAAVTVCVPGTATCQTIDGLLVDTGSTGLRIRSSVLTIALPPEQNTAGNPIFACGQFADGSYMWGPVARADIRMSAERASSVSIQIVADPAASSFPAPPTGCSSGGGQNLGAPDGFPAKGILGLSFYEQDCGDPCVTGTGPGVYYRCVSSTCTTTRLAITSQMTNPVSAFAADNNGVSVSLPSVPLEGSASVTGTLTFGIGTQANNGLGAAKLLVPDANGYLTTAFGGKSYGSTTIDTGANAFFFTAANAAAFPACQNNKGFYCPASTLALSASIAGAGGGSATVAFNVANADSLFTVAHSAYPDVAGSAALGDAFSWGLPFFFGRTVFTAFQGRTTPGGTGPYWAY